MSKETQELTRNPNLIAFQTNLLAEYREKNKTAKKGQVLFIGSSIMELFPIEKWEEAGEVKFEKYRAPLKTYEKRYNRLKIS